MIHGFGGSSAMWRKQVQDLKSTYNIALVSLYGHSKTKEGLKDKDIRSFSDLGRDLVIILESEGIHKAHFMGMSLGSMVICGVMSYKPELVSKIILGGSIATSSKLYNLAGRFVNTFKGLIPYTLLVKLACFIVAPKRSQKIERDFYINSNRRLGTAEFNKWFDLAISEVDILKYIDWLDKKVLMIMGSEDFIFLNGVKSLVNREKQVSLEIIEKCGHLCSMERYMEFNSLTKSFLLLG